MENLECNSLKDCSFFRLESSMVELCLYKSKKDWDNCAIVISVHGDDPIVIPIKKAQAQTGETGKALFCALESSILDTADAPVYKRNLTFIGQDVNSMSDKMKTTIQKLIKNDETI